ncbi:root UVB sensitive protein (Protein of unknown function, DUF647) isoform X2 [Wolffia australiana]
MLSEGGMASFYAGLGIYLIGTAPFIVVNFYMFDLCLLLFNVVKKSLQETHQMTAETSPATVSQAMPMLYLLDAMRRQRPVNGLTYDGIVKVFPGTLEHGRVLELYHGFIPSMKSFVPNKRGQPMASAAALRLSPKNEVATFIRGRRACRPCRCYGDSSGDCWEGEKVQGPDTDGADEERIQRVFLVEKYENGAAKRYMMDSDLRLHTSWRTDGAINDAMTEEGLFKKSFWFPDALKRFILPEGFPGSVSDDYLDYMLLQFPTNVTGWICHTLVTSSLLKAVGVGSFSGTSAAASAAVIKWVSKDGIGALGRLLVGGRFGKIFDDDPKLWRLYADFIGSAGSIFELSTQLYPVYFLPLASLGNLSKAVARGLKDPSFRVIQNHFAISGNLGEVSAKEEVWEVGAQLIGLGIGILILDASQMETSYSMLAFTWLIIRSLHLVLRYQSLSVLKFSTINQKRARILVKSHVSSRTVPDCTTCNREEDILSWEQFLRPRIVFGVPFERTNIWKNSPQMVKAILRLYSKEQYVLSVEEESRERPKFFVSLKAGATGQTLVRSLWQAYWLDAHGLDKDSESVLGKLERSLEELDSGFDDFMLKLRSSGWDDDAITIKVPKGPLLEETFTV